MLDKETRMKKQLIIVANDEYLKYATYLQGLISSTDDEEGRHVGTKDGSVSAVIWDEEHHKANLKSLTSGNPVVFFGDSKYVRKNCSEASNEYFEFGMSYGWLGNHANLRVTKDSLNKNNAHDFYKMAERYGKRFEEELSFLFSTEKDAEDGNSPDDHALLLAELAFPPALLFDLALNRGKSKFVERLSSAIDKGVDMTKSLQALDQQYTLLTLVFYLDGLSKFLGE